MASERKVGVEAPAIVPQAAAVLTGSFLAGERTTRVQPPVLLVLYSDTTHRPQEPWRASQ